MRQWVSSPKNVKKPKVPVGIKNDINKLATKFIEEKLKPNHIEEKPDNIDRNYIIDITSKWFRNYYYFVATYKAEYPEAICDKFDIKFARIEYSYGDTYNLSYMRHTGKWQEVYQNLSFKECLDIIENDEIFFP